MNWRQHSSGIFSLNPKIKRSLSATGEVLDFEQWISGFFCHLDQASLAGVVVSLCISGSTEDEETKPSISHNAVGTERISGVRLCLFSPGACEFSWVWFWKLVLCARLKVCVCPMMVWFGFLSVSACQSNSIRRYICTPWCILTPVHCEDLKSFINHSMLH